MKTEQSWLSRNFTNVMTTIIAVLVGAFFTDFQFYKTEQREDRIAMDSRMKNAEIAIAIHDFSLQEMQKKVNELCSNYVQLYTKINTRSGKPNLDSSSLTKK